jgi:hypothetical protein
MLVKTHRRPQVVMRCSSRSTLRFGDRDFLARDEDADVALLAPKDRLPADDRSSDSAS